MSESTCTNPMCAVETYYTPDYRCPLCDYFDLASAEADL